MQHTYSKLMNSNHIILSAGLFGSIYIFSISLGNFSLYLMNKKDSREDNRLTIHEVLNGTIMCVSGCIVAVTSLKAMEILARN